MTSDVRRNRGLMRACARAVAGLAVAATVAATLAGGMLAACGDSGDGSGGDAGGGSGLEDAVWVLSSYFDGTATQVVPATIRVDARFGDDTVGGSAPVNSYSGPYTTGGDSAIDIGPVASTMMAGPAKAMALEAAYFKALEAVRSYSVEGGTLHLADGEGVTLLTYAAEAPPTLTGRTWKATGYNNGNEAVVSLVAGSDVTAVFGDTDTVSGSSGVNTYEGPYTVAGTSMSVGDLTTTRVAGPAELMKQEQQYLAALRSAATWSVSGGALELRTADGDLAVTYTTEPTPLPD